MPLSVFTYFKGIQWLSVAQTFFSIKVFYFPFITSGGFRNAKELAVKFMMN